MLTQKEIITAIVLGCPVQLKKHITFYPKGSLLYFQGFALAYKSGKIGVEKHIVGLYLSGECDKIDVLFSLEHLESGDWIELAVD